MSAIPYRTQSVPNGPIILHRSGFLTASLSFSDTSGQAKTLLVRALVLEQGVPDSSGQLPDVTGGHLFPNAQTGQPLSYYQGLLGNPAGLTATIQVPANGQSQTVQWSSAPLSPVGSNAGASGVLGVFWVISDAQTGAQNNLWSPNVVEVLFS